MEFIPKLLAIMILLFMGYWWGVASCAQPPEEGLALPSGQTEPAGYFCRRSEVCQAFRVSDGYFPDWVIQSGAEVVIFPKPRITLKQGNTYVQATAADYLLKLQDGTILAVPVEQFETRYQAIDPV